MERLPERPQFHSQPFDDLVFIVEEEEVLGTTVAQFKVRPSDRNIFRETIGQLTPPERAITSRARGS